MKSKSSGWDFSKNPFKVIVTSIIGAIIFTITIYETFRLPALKEDIERYKNEINNKKFQIIKLTQENIELKKGYSNRNDIAKNNKVNKKEFQVNNKINNLSEIKDLIIEGQEIKDLNDKDINLERYKQWRTKGISVIESINEKEYKQYAQEFDSVTFVKGSKTQTIDIKIERGLKTLNIIKYKLD